jgi:hypothetical protein
MATTRAARAIIDPGTRRRREVAQPEELVRLNVTWLMSCVEPVEAWAWASSGVRYDATDNPSGRIAQSTRRMAGS